jgi:uncharacterized membrane protein HdeD (DUF308 family)
MFKTMQEFLTTLATTVSIAGVICLILGIFIMVKQAIGKNLQTIATQTTKLAEKGITDGVSGLVGNASLLIDALNGMVKSNTGIGIFLVFLGIALLCGAYFLVRPLFPELP